jgi:two-component system, sensor histidine kinase and response regulator
VNQRLIIRMLEKRGHRVALARNGAEAVGLFEKNSFDLALMDRNRLDSPAGARYRPPLAHRCLNGSSHPSRAFARHAMKGDQERCLAAGMDEYLSKPIHPQELDQVLSRQAQALLNSPNQGMLVENK